MYILCFLLSCILLPGEAWDWPSLGLTNNHRYINMHLSLKGNIHPMNVNSAIDLASVTLIFSLSPSGCVLPFDNVTSRTFASLQSSCHHSCDMHRALQAATDQFRAHHCSLLFRRENQDQTVELTHQNPGRVSRAGPHRRQEHHSGKRLHQ